GHSAGAESLVLVTGGSGHNEVRHKIDLRSIHPNSHSNVRVADAIDEATGRRCCRRLIHEVCRQTYVSLDVWIERVAQRRIQFQNRLRTTCASLKASGKSPPPLLLSVQRERG